MECVVCLLLTMRCLIELLLLLALRQRLNEPLETFYLIQVVSLNRCERIVQYRYPSHCTIVRTANTNETDEEEEEENENEEVDYFGCIFCILPSLALR